MPEQCLPGPHIGAGFQHPRGDTCRKVWQVTCLAIPATRAAARLAFCRLLSSR
jgi:hypothetical protein